MRRGLGFHARRSPGVFNPASLFLGGTVNGAWYDPSDSTTLFSDRAGTTPCGTPGGGSVVPVGRMLDKSGNGNHATAANDTTARPELRARVNLLTYSEQFDSGVWNKSNVTVVANAAVAPDGTTTADRLYPTSSGTSRYLWQETSGLVINATYRMFVQLKNAGKNFGYIYNVRGNQLFWVNLTTGVTSDVGSNITNLTSSIDANGWVTVSFDSVLLTGTAGVGYFYVGVSDASGSTSVTTNGTDGIYVWGADLRPANIGTAMPAYQRISDANTYDAVGFPRYLACNGTSSAMSTPGNVNLSGTDKVTVFAGVRKLSTGVGGIVELSATAANPGTFNLFANGVVVNDYFFGLSGTNQLYGNNTGFAPPVSNVLTEQLNQAGATDAQRVSARSNGTSLALTYSGNIGTPGNFGSYPLFIGSRNNASLFLNGNIYSLIVVGSAVSAGQISATEQWIAQRTGITI